jgi:hypothetical protein
MQYSLEGVKAGDELLLFVRMGGRREKEQEPKVVTVAKVGRTLVHVLKYEGRPEHGTDAYRIEHGYRNDDYGHTQLMTREGWEDQKRRYQVIDELRRHGVDVGVGGTKPTAVLEALLDVMERYTKGEA